MKLYKLTDKDGQTRNQTQWGEGITHVASGSGKDLCSDGFIHAYEHPLIALLMNPIHANFNPPRLWEAEGEVVLRDGQIKCGCVALTTIREIIPLPTITLDMRVQFALRGALHVYADPSFVQWANHWLDGSDRSEQATDAAWAAADAAWAAADAVMPMRAAKAAAWAAADAAEAAADAVMPMRAAKAAAWAAADAAEAAANPLDLISIAEAAYQA